MNPLHDPVCVLLETPFSKWNENDKKDFLSCEKPTPLLNVYKMAKIKDRVYKRNFIKAWYVEFEWLCGSFYLNKLFCVSCIIIGSKPGVWNKHGFNDFGNVTRALHKHEGSSDHIRCQLDFSRLKKRINTIEEALQENSRLYIKCYNENVQLNRRYMQLAIRTILYLSRQGLPFEGQSKDAASVKCSNFQELLENFISISPIDIQEHYGKNILLKSDYNTIQNQTIDCISQYIDEYIENEIKECNFFSIQVDDLTDIIQKSQCSLIIRYVKPGGDLVERFLGLYDVKANQTTDTLFNLTSHCIKSKLVGLCSDEASVVSGQLNELQTKVKELAPQAVFVHSLAHPLSLVLQQSCKSISKCHVFFATVNTLSTFFHHSLKRSHVGDKRIPNSAISRWTSISKIINVINNEWDTMKQVLTDIMNDPFSDQVSVSQSNGFLNKFNDLEFAFLVVAFSNIFDVTDELFEVLQNKPFDVNFCISKIKNKQMLLNMTRNESTFKDIFDLAASRTPVRSIDNEKRDQILEKYKILYYIILDTLSLQISARFEDMRKLHFIKLMDTSKFVLFSEEFPTGALHSLQTHYSNIFTDIQRLKNELELIYDEEQYRDVKPQHLLKLLSENCKIFKEAYKLFCLIVTIPSTGVPAGSIPCLERVKTCLRNNMTQDKPKNVSKISIEKELLNELIIERTFYDDIIDRFATLEDKTIDVMFKK